MTYVLWPGEVVSQADGQRHHVGVGQLRRLYKIPPDAKVVVVPEWSHLPAPQGPDLVHCRPRDDGAYPVFER